MSTTRQASDKCHPVHPDHELFPITAILTLKCDACNIQEKQCYRCEECDFNLCKKCFSEVNSPLHAHALNRTDVRYVYHQSNGGWTCDVCHNNNGPGHHYPSHCSSCQFDLCDNCIKPRKSTIHPGHIMYKADSNLVYPNHHGSWRCDRCSESFSPQMQMNNNPFHCSQCEFDLCSNCMKVTSEESNAEHFLRTPHAFLSNLSKSGISDSGTRSPFLLSANKKTVVTQGEEPIGRTGVPDDPEGKCVICRVGPKDATIIHGETGHVCCCTVCAAKLFIKNDVCPICRAPIDSFIKYHIS